MPKKQAQRRIDKQAGTGSRTVTVTTTGGGSGSGGLVAHALAGSSHTGTLAQAQAPWAITETEFDAHTANANAHHNRRHGVTSATDHTITADAYAFVGATGTDTLGLLYIASSGDGIDVAKSSSTFTIAVDVSDFDGAGLGDDGFNNLYVKTAEGVTLSGDNVIVDESYDFAWTGDHSHTKTVGTPTFYSGFTGAGWRVQYGAHNDSNGTAIGAENKARLEVDDLTVRGQLSVYELLLRQIRATNGNVFVSDAAKIATVSGSGPFTLSVADDDVHGFAVGDLIRAQRFNGDGVYQSNMQVTSVTNTQTFVASLTSGDDPAAGMDFVRLGNASDSGRRGSIYLSSADTYAPYIDVVDGVDAFTDWNSTDVLKMRMGRLDGITDPDFGVLSGYGLYVKGGGYFKGDVAAASADVVLNDSGVNIAIDDAATGLTQVNAVTWTSDTISPSDSDTAAYIIGARYSDGGESFHHMRAIVPFGTTTLTDGADMDIRLASSDDSNDDVFIALQTNNSFVGNETFTGRSVWLYSDNVFVQSQMVMAGNIVPYGLTYNLGTADTPWAELHVDTLYAGTVSSVDTGHNHNDLYYSKAQIDSQATGYAPYVHSHASYINSATLTSTLADYVTSSSLTITLADYLLEVDFTNTIGLYVTSASLTSTLNNYVTSASLATTLGDYVTDSALTTTLDDYVTDTALDDLLAAGVTPASHDIVSSHSVTAAQYAVLSTWGSANTLSMVTATNDGSAGHKLLKTDANGDLTISDLTGVNATLSGYLTSDDYVSGVSGWQISGGDAEFGALTARGAFRSAVFEIGSTAVFSSRQLIVKSSGTMYESIAIATSGGTEYHLKIDYPSRGEYVIAEVGDVLRIRGLASYTAATASGNSTTPVWEFWSPQVRPSGLSPVDIWFTITGINKGVGYYSYTCEWESGSDNVTILAGEAVAVYGQSGDGVIESVANGSGAPYIDVRTHSGSPWTDETTHVRIGQLGGLSGVRAALSEWGLAAGSMSGGTNAYVVVSDQQAKINNVDLTMTDSDGEFFTVDSTAGVTLTTPLASYNNFTGYVPDESRLFSFADDSSRALLDFGAWGADIYDDEDLTSYTGRYVTAQIEMDRAGVFDGANFYLKTANTFDAPHMILSSAGRRAELNIGEDVRGEFSLSYPGMGSTQALLRADFITIDGLASISRMLMPVAISEAQAATGELYIDGSGFVKRKSS